MSSQRYIELDALRTLAIGGMILYHTAFDLSQFYGWDIDVFDSGWKILQIATASLFLLLVGVTSLFSTRHPYKRFMQIGSAALLVTVATYVIDPQTYVRFGILHLIAVSALILPFIKGLRAWLIIPAAILIAINPVVSSLTVDSSLLLPLGIPYRGFSSVDYFPLIPWFGVILIGYVIGFIAYIRFPEWRAARTDAISWRLYLILPPTLYTWIAWPGRHSLLLYLIHQPIILGVLWMSLGKPAL